ATSTPFCSMTTRINCPADNLMGYTCDCPAAISRSMDLPASSLNSCAFANAQNRQNATGNQPRFAVTITFSLLFLRRITDVNQCNSIDIRYAGNARDNLHRLLMLQFDQRDQNGTASTHVSLFVGTILGNLNLMICVLL